MPMNARILLVEDELGAIATLKRALARGGFELLVATNGPDALSLAENERPEAVVVSDALQGGASAALCEALQRGNPGRPIVLLGEGHGGVALRIPRPVDGEELAALLRSCLGASPVPAGPSATPPPEAPPRATPAEDHELSLQRAEQAAQRKAEAMARAALQRRRELSARKTQNVAAEIPAPEPIPPTSPAPTDAAAPPGSLADRLFGDLVDEPAAPTPPTTEIATAEAASVPPRPEASPRASAPRLARPRPPFELPLEGDLAVTEPAQLLAACRRSHWLGELSLSQGNVRRSIYWEEGRISGAASTSPDEQLEALAYRRGLLTLAQQREIRAECFSGARRSALAMVERTFLKPAELFPLVQARALEICFGACGTPQGRYRLSDAQAPTDERVALTQSPLAVMTEALRRKCSLERALDRIGGPSTLLRPISVGAPELSEFGLGARERRLAQAVDGLRSVEELLFETGFEPLAGLQILHALALGRFVEIAVRGLPADLTLDVEAAIDLARVAEKYEQVRTASYFEVLGVDRAATRYEVQEAYDRLAREFEPGRQKSFVDPALRERLEEIQRVLAEARDVLADEWLRESYTRHR